jgi:diacylglycerol kinase (ATP)
MRVALLFNANAGDGEALHEIERALRRHGHELVCLVEEEREADRLLDAPCDLVVAAGGDGTVGLAARTVARRDVPLAILPLGTANNIALTLGIDGQLDDLLAAWKLAQGQPLDIGIAGGALSPTRFVEGVGVGLIPAGIAAANTLAPDQTRRCLSNLARTVQVYRDALSQLQPLDCTVDVDGTRVAGSFLSIEAFNIPFIGPNLVLASDANPSDGLLSVSLVRDEQRQQLDEYLRHRIEGMECPVPPAPLRGRQIEIAFSGPLHVDDELYSGTHVSVQVEEAAVTVLL